MSYHLLCYFLIEEVVTTEDPAAFITTTTYILDNFLDSELIYENATEGIWS